MKKQYSYFFVYFYSEGIKSITGHCEVKLINKIESYKEIQHAAELIAKENKFKNLPTILFFKELEKATENNHNCSDCIYFHKPEESTELLMLKKAEIESLKLENQAIRESADKWHKTAEVNTDKYYELLNVTRDFVNKFTERFILVANLNFEQADAARNIASTVAKGLVGAN